MKYFLDALEWCKTEGYFSTISKIKDAQPFVLIPGQVEEDWISTDLRSLKVSDIKLDLPFKICSFEITYPNSYALQHENGPRYIVDCIIAEEVSPEEIVFYAFGDFGRGRELKMATVHDCPGMWTLIGDALQDYLKKFQSSQHGTSSPRTIFKWKENGEKKQLRINKVIHYRSRSKAHSEEYSHTIQWSHAFWVMGHWRTINGLGKDRDGIYRIAGKTWVESFVKQAELGDPIKKIRLVKEEAH